MELQHSHIRSNLSPQDAELSVHPHYRILQPEVLVDSNACLYKCPQIDPSDSVHSSTPDSDLSPTLSPAKHRQDDLRGQDSTLNKL